MMNARQVSVRFSKRWSRSRIIIAAMLAGGVVSTATGVNAAPNAHSSPDAQAVPSAHTPRAAKAASSFSGLKSEKDGWKIIKNSSVVSAMKSVMGGAYDSYLDATQLVAEPEFNGDEITVTAGVRGLFTEMESVLAINKRTNRVVVGVVGYGNVDVYGAKNSASLPVGFKSYLADLEKRAGKAMTLAFNAPAKASLARAAAKPKRSMDATTFTGTYKNERSRQEGAELLVLQMPESQMKFSLNANSGGHTGSADGTIKIVNHSGTYKDSSGYTLHFQIGKDKIIVNQTGDGFGGMGVTANGTYSRITDAQPRFE